ncbi:F-box protein CPR1-like [Fagus crenata]
MDSLPTEIMTDIFSRLPVKSLLRFRSVSNTFLAMIDSPKFMKLHLKQSLKTNTNRTIIFTDFGRIYSSDLDSLDNAIQLQVPLTNSVEVVGSCDGLLCLLNSVGDLAIWNPSTRAYREVPDPWPTMAIMFSENAVMWSDFDPYGFGYDETSNDYKVVQLIEFKEDLIVRNAVFVYNLKTNTWRKLSSDCTHEFPHSHGKLACGALHWTGTSHNEDIIAFDLGLEEFRVIPQPDYSEPICYKRVDMLGGSLAIVCMYGEQQHQDVWLMKEYNVKESWMKLFSVLQPSTSPLSLLNALAYSESGEEVLLKNEESGFVWFDLKNKRVKISNVEIPGVDLSWLHVDFCWATLVPLDANGVQEEDANGVQEEDAENADEGEPQEEMNRNTRDDVDVGQIEQLPSTGKSGPYFGV